MQFFYKNTFLLALICIRIYNTIVLLKEGRRIIRLVLYISIMNKTKRKIFEASMKLFAEKGYDATSIEEITATVGVAKGTLYYHFSSKEEIFQFLVEEGVKLLKNSIIIKTSKLENAIDKIRAVVLIEIKVLSKYENFMSIILSQIWGNDARNKMCRDYVFEYIKMIEDIVKEGINNGEIIEGDANLIASGIFGFICSIMITKLRSHEQIDIPKLYKEIDNIFLRKLKRTN